MLESKYIRYLDNGTVQWRDPWEPDLEWDPPKWETFHGTITELVALVRNLRREARSKDWQHPLTKLEWEAYDEAQTQGNEPDGRADTDSDSCASPEAQQQTLFTEG